MPACWVQVLPALFGKGCDNMKLFSKLILVVFALVLLLSLNVYASNLDKIEGIIDGEADHIIFGSIEEVHGGGECTVTVSGIVGEDSLRDTDDVNDSKVNHDVNTITSDSQITVDNFYSYMYFDKGYRAPKKGDNILLPLKFDGNVFHADNGVFLVTAADFDSFRLKAPDNLETDSYAELTALYFYVKSNTKNSDFNIQDGKVFSHKGDDLEEAGDVPTGIDFTDEYGNSVDAPKGIGAPEKSSSKGNFSLPGEKWIYTCIILIIGSVVGVFVGRVAQK